MKIKNLVIECEQIVCTSTTKRGEDNAHIKMTLEDIRTNEVMVNIIKEVGVEAVLDHISDTQISNYLKGTK